MPRSKDDWIDEDIASMELEQGEKAGLQVYRNYTRSFEKNAIKHFVDTIDKESLNLTEFQRLADLVIKEDERSLPIIVCAFADDLLKETFKSVLPDGIPGGKRELFKVYGPLSDFAKRIQVAYAFDIFSQDLLTDLDCLRSVRNKISHSWDVEVLKDFYVEGKVKEITNIEKMLIEKEDTKDDLGSEFKPLEAFRIRLLWIIGRLVYEGAIYNRAKSVKLDPANTLYGKVHPRYLNEIAKIAYEYTKKVMRK